jgi:fatty-acid desaturase
MASGSGGARRNFDTNAATNIRLLAWFTGGESLHNNHHAYPSSPKFSMGRFEFDPSWVAIRLLMVLRLCRSGEFRTNIGRVRWSRQAYSGTLSRAKRLGAS